MAVGNARRLAWECPCSVVQFLRIQWVSERRLESAGWQVGFTGLHKHLLAAASFARESLCTFEA